MIDLIKAVKDQDGLKEKDENKISNDIDVETYWKRAISNFCDDIVKESRKYLK